MPVSSRSVPAVQLTGPVHVAPLDALLDDLASLIAAAAMRAVEDRGVFHLALSGGSTPEPLYVRMVIDPRYRAIPWQATHLWLVDERRVPHDDERSNYRMIREALIEHVPLRRRNVHPMPVDGADDDRAYETLLRRTITDGRLDFVLLGMGGDGHTASLFPRSPALAAASRLVAINEGESVTPPPRLTMTLALLNRARQVAVLVTGAAKAPTLRRIDAALAAGEGEVDELPILGVDPDEGEVMWFLDPAAAGRAG